MHVCTSALCGSQWLWPFWAVDICHPVLPDPALTLALPHQGSLISQADCGSSLKKIRCKCRGKKDFTPRSLNNMRSGCRTGSSVAHLSPLFCKGKTMQKLHSVQILLCPCAYGSYRCLLPVVLPPGPLLGWQVAAVSSAFSYWPLVPIAALVVVL